MISTHFGMGQTVSNATFYAGQLIFRYFNDHALGLTHQAGHEQMCVNHYYEYLHTKKKIKINVN